MRTRREQWAFWVVNHTPNVVIATPERVFFSVLQMVAGAATFIAFLRPPSLQEAWPEEIVFSWSTTLFLAGFATILGILRNVPLLERFGASLTVLASIVYLGVSIVVYGWTGNLIGLTFFFGLGWSAATRLVVQWSTHLVARKRIEEEQ